jgi:hypothetical protein
VAEGNDLDESRADVWTVRTLYAALLAVNLWLALDWWKDTPSGAATIEGWRRRLVDLKARAENCEGCAKRRNMLAAAVNRVQWQAERIIEGEDVPTVPDPEAPA